MHEVQDYISRVRGAMLSVSWSIERQLSVIIEYQVLGPTGHSDGRVLLRNDLIEELPFGKKARLAKSIAHQKTDFDAATFSTLIDSVVRNRNALAHGLASLEPVLDHSGFCTGFFAVLEHKTSKWDLTEELAGRWIAEAHQCLTLSDELTSLISSQLPCAQMNDADEKVADTPPG